MKRKGRVLLGVVICMLLAACAKEPDDSEQVSRIIDGESYIEVMLEKAYHQSEVLFDSQKDRAVIPNHAEWGRPGFRDGDEAGIYYGEAEGGEIFETDEEISPELYLHVYLDSVRNLNLTAAEVKDEGYVIQVAEKTKLKPFEKELRLLTGIVMKNHYELTGVEITFDKQCRPVQKTFQLQDIDEDELKKGSVESGEYVQKFSYNTGAAQFERAFKKVKKEIEQE